MSKPPQLDQALSVMPRTRKQQEIHRKKGLITSFFHLTAGLKNGRPKKSVAAPAVVGTPTAIAANNASDIPRSYRNWSLPENVKHLSDATKLLVDDKCTIAQVLNKYEIDPDLPSLVQEVLSRAKAKLTKERAGELPSSNIHTKRAALLNETNKEFLQQIIKVRDEANNGMTRSEFFTCIQMLVGCDIKTAENYYDYLVRENKLQKLKAKGKAVVA